MHRTADGSDIAMAVVFAICFGVCGLGIGLAIGPDEGEERGPCYGNDTCNKGLTCLSQVCVNQPDAAP